MASGDKIFIADKATLDRVLNEGAKQSTLTTVNGNVNTINSNTTNTNTNVNTLLSRTLKTPTDIGQALFVSNVLETTNTEESNTVLTLSGRGKLNKILVNSASISSNSRVTIKVNNSSVYILYFNVGEQTTLELNIPFTTGIAIKNSNTNLVVKYEYELY